MSKKTISRSLFNAPIPYERKPFRKTELLTYLTDDAGNSLVSLVCVEDKFSNSIPLNYKEVSLDNLVAKGVDSRALDMIDSSKLGVDEGIDRLVQHLVSNSEKYVVSSKSE